KKHVHITVLAWGAACCAPRPPSPAATSTVLREISPGVQMSIGGVVDVVDAAARGSDGTHGYFLVAAICRSEAELLTVRGTPSLSIPGAYDVGTVRVRAGERNRVEDSDVTLGGSTLSEFLADVGHCQTIRVYAGGPVVTIHLGADGKVESISKAESAADGRR